MVERSPSALTSLSPAMLSFSPRETWCQPTAVYSKPEISLSTRVCLRASPTRRKNAWRPKALQMLTWPQADQRRLHGDIRRQRLSQAPSMRDR